MRSVVETSRKRVQKSSVAEKSLEKSVVEKHCTKVLKRVLWRSVGEGSCTEGWDRRVAEKCCTDVL